MSEKKMLADRSEETSCLEQNLERMEGELQKKYYEMGKNLMELAGHEQRAINRLVDEIIMTRKQLIRTSYQWQCPACMTVNSAGQGKCENCGGSRTKDSIHLLFALDENYLPPLMVTLASIFANNPGEVFNLWLMHEEISEEKLLKLEAFCDGCDAVLYTVQVEPSAFEGTPVMRHYTKEMYYRLLAPKLLPESLDKVLYLDPDLLVINSIRPLWDMDMMGMTFAAASHTGMTEFANAINKVRLGTDHNYFNSGVLLMDLIKAREEVIPEDIFRYAQEHKAELLLPDQDIFNGLYGSMTLEIDDYVWNYDARNYSNYLVRSNGTADVDWVMKNTAILHFCGSGKPWNKQYRQKFGVLYKHYMQVCRVQGGTLD